MGEGLIGDMVIIICFNFLGLMESECVVIVFCDGEMVELLLWEENLFS